LGPGPRLIKKNYQAAVSQGLRNTALQCMHSEGSVLSSPKHNTGHCPEPV